MGCRRCRRHVLGVCGVHIVTVSQNPEPGGGRVFGLAQGPGAMTHSHDTWIAPQTSACWFLCLLLVPLIGLESSRAVPPSGPHRGGKLDQMRRRCSLTAAGPDFWTRSGLFP